MAADRSRPEAFPSPTRDVPLDVASIDRVELPSAEHWNQVTLTIYEAVPVSRRALEVPQIGIGPRHSRANAANVMEPGRFRDHLLDGGQDAREAQSSPSADPIRPRLDRDAL